MDPTKNENYPLGEQTGIATNWELPVGGSPSDNAAKEGISRFWNICDDVKHSQEAMRLAKLSAGQLRLLRVFYRNLGKVTTRQEAMDRAAITSSSCFSVQLHRVKRFLKTDGYMRLVLVMRVGYALMPTTFEVDWREDEAVHFAGAALQGYFVRFNHQLVQLQSPQADLLRVLFSRPNELVSYDELLGEKMDRGYEVAKRTMDVQVYNLRVLLEQSEVEIVSVYGQGYFVRKRGAKRTILVKSFVPHEEPAEYRYAEVCHIVETNIRRLIRSSSTKVIFKSCMKAGIAEASRTFIKEATTAVASAYIAAGNLQNDHGIAFRIVSRELVGEMFTMGKCI